MAQRRIHELATLALLTFGVLLAPGCSEDPVSVDRIEADFVLSPEELQAIASTDPNFEWMISFDGVLSESGGTVGATVDGLTVAVEEAQSGIRVGNRAGDEWLLVLDAPSTQLDPGTTLTIGLEVFYTLETGAKEAIVDVTILLTDDNGAILVGTVEFHALP